MHINWYKHQRPVYSLKITDKMVQGICENAFLHEAFERLRNITLIGMPVQILPRGMFNGLRYLVYLHLEGFQLKQIENDVLGEVPSLIWLKIIASMQPTTTFNHFFGNSTVSHQLEALDYSDNNLANGITIDTFGNLTTVTRIYLPRNEITSIAENAFVIVGQSLLVIDLRGNQLKTLPEAFFKSILVGQDAAKVRMALSENPWHCSCDLHWLQTLLRNHSKLLSTEVICASPFYLSGKSFVKSNICAYNNTSTVSTPAIAIQTRTDAPLNGRSSTVAPSNVISLSCPSGDDVFETEFIRNDKISNITTMSNGSVRVHLRSFPMDQLLIWYENDFPRHVRSAEFIKCIGSDDKNGTDAHIVPVNMTELVMNKTYVFCMAHRETLAISPLNCISYQHTKHNGADGMLLEPKKKSIRLIGTIVVGFFITAILGMLF